MPGRDGTGPRGDKAFYGRRRGLCHLANPAVAIGCGLGLGLGMGFRGGRSTPTTAPEASGLSQKEILEEQKRLLKTRLSYVDNQLENLKED